MPRWHLYWYAAQFSKDDAETVDYDKSLQEYLASIVSNEGAKRVKSLMDSRDGKSQAKMDEEFDGTVEQLFGRTVGKVDRELEQLRLNEEDLDTIRILKSKPTP